MTPRTVGSVANRTDQSYANVMVAYRARLAVVAIKAMSRNIRGNRVIPKKNLNFHKFHNFSETLIAWNIRDYGGDSWSDENLSFAHPDNGLMDSPSASFE